MTLVSGKAVWMGEKEKERQRENMAERKGKEEEKDKEGGNSWKIRRSFFFFFNSLHSMQILSSQARD